jgi:hypothetical protein
MAQSWSLSVLGWVPGIITMLVSGILFYITSLTMHKFIMKHPSIKDICDFGYFAFGKSRVAYHFTSVLLLLNNVVRKLKVQVQRASLADFDNDVMASWTPS